MNNIWILLKILIIIQCACVFCDSEVNSSVPHLPQPEYDSDGNPKWFPRIVGGSPVALGEFKGIVSLQALHQKAHFCGGTLINASFVLTAAHCLTDSETGRIADPAKLRVMGDDINITTSSSVRGQRQIRAISQIFVHPQYSVRTIENDIAIIRIKPPFNITNTFHPVPLPTGPPPLNGTCRVAGWGTTKENGTVSPNLLAVNVDIVPIRTCNRTGIYDGMLRSQMFCAGAMEGGRDSCQGDSGGGLICNSIVTGIVSFGRGCGRKNLPGVYTNVYGYLPWIAKVFAWSENQTPPVPTTVKPRPSSASIFSLQTNFFVICAMILALVSIPF